MEALRLIQSELKAPKGQYNSFGKYKYRSCEDILEAAKPILAKHNTALTLSDELVLIGDRYYIKATATLIAANGSISTTAYAREDETKKGMDGSQITGTASSYARKYALNGLFCIDDTKDDDAEESRNEQQNRAAAQQGTQRNGTVEVNNPTADDIETLAADAAAKIGVSDRDSVIKNFVKLGSNTKQQILKTLGLERIEDIHDQADIKKVLDYYRKLSKRSASRGEHGTAS